jgi:phage terminase small subunit
MPKLKNQRRERFAQEVFKGRTEITAYKRAGYTGDPKKNAAKIAALPDVQDRITELNRKIERSAIMDKTEALEMLTKGARAAFDFLQTAGQFGKKTITLDSAQIEANPDLKHAIREVVVHADENKTTIRLHNPADLIALIGKMEGWEAPKDINIRRRPLEEMTDSELDDLEGGLPDA